MAKKGGVSPRRMLDWMERCAPPELFIIFQQQEEIAMRLSEMVAALGEVNAQLGKAKVEILAKIDALQVALADVEVPTAATEALDAARAAAQALDDVVPDTPPVG